MERHLFGIKNSMKKNIPYDRNIRTHNILVLTRIKFCELEGKEKGVNFMNISRIFLMGFILSFILIGGAVLTHPVSANQDKVALCHHTESETNEWVVQEVNANEVQSHLDNGDKLYTADFDIHSQEAKDWCAGITPTVTPEITPDVTETPEASPTAEVTVEPTTPPSPHGDGLSDGRSDGKSSDQAVLGTQIAPCTQSTCGWK